MYPSSVNDMCDKKTILIVDDDASARNLLALILKQLPQEIRLASSGYEALDMVATYQPCLMILDLQMPEMSGFDVLAHLGDDPETANIPVIVFSVHARKAEALGYYWPAQVVATLEKDDVRPEEFRRLVRYHLNGHGSLESSTSKN